MSRVFVFESWWLSGDKKGKGGVESGSGSSCKGVFRQVGNGVVGERCVDAIFVGCVGIDVSGVVWATYEVLLLVVEVEEVLVLVLGKQEKMI